VKLHHSYLSRVSLRFYKRLFGMLSGSREFGESFVDKGDKITVSFASTSRRTSLDRFFCNFKNIFSFNRISRGTRVVARNEFNSFFLVIILHH